MNIHIILNSNLTFTGYSGGFHANEMEVFDAEKCYVKYYNFEIAKRFHFLCWSTFSDYGGPINENVFHGTGLMPKTWFSTKTHKYFCSMNSTNHGDSGGPLMLQVSYDSWIVVGITSHGFSKRYMPDFCGHVIEEVQYSAHQLVALYLPWIRNVIDSYDKLGFDSFFESF